MSGLLLAGDIFIDLLDETGASTGLIGPINTTKLAIKAEAETKVRASTKKGNFGQALDSVNIPKPTGISIAFDDQPAEMFAALLMGEVSKINEAASTVTDEAITLPAYPKWAQLSKRNLSDASLTAKKGSTPLVIGVGFEINYAAGLIRATKDGTVKDGGAITVTFQNLAVSGTRIKAGVKSQIKASILLQGKNLVNGRDVQLSIPSTTLSPTSEVDFMGSEFVTGELGGTINVPMGQTEPYTYDEL